MSSTPADLGLSLTHCRLHVRDTAALTDFYTKVVICVGTLSLHQPSFLLTIDPQDMIAKCFLIQDSRIPEY